MRNSVQRPEGPLPRPFLSSSFQFPEPALAGLSPSRTLARPAVPYTAFGAIDPVWSPSVYRCVRSGWFTHSEIAPSGLGRRGEAKLLAGAQGFVPGMLLPRRVRHGGPKE